MRKPFFRKLNLEELERLVLPNLFFGQVGTPVSGLPSSNSEAPGLDGSSLVALNAITKSAGDGQANNGLLTHASGGHGNSIAISGTGHHCCSHVEIEASALPGSAKIPNADAVQETASASGEFRSLGDVANLAAGFDSLVDNSFDSAFPSAKNATLVLAGGGDSGMSVGSQTSASAAALGTGSGTLSGNTGVSGGFTATAVGSFALTTPAQNGPMILLPASHPSSSVVAGFQKASPGSPQISPAVASGPLHQECLDPICLGAPAYVPVNADNDNGSAVTNGIPTQRDFSVNPLSVNDPELLQATLTTSGLPNTGTWGITIVTTPGAGNIALWTDQRKSAEFFAPSPGQLGPFNFYIEGVHESKQLNDITLTFDYEVPTCCPSHYIDYSATAQITVTPLIKGFVVKPAAGPNGQNINFVDQGPPVDGLKGLIAAVPAQPGQQAQSGAAFGADVIRTALNGNSYFIQNLTDVKNGNNGSAAGWVYTVASGLANQNLLPKPVQPPLAPLTFPFLDAKPNTQNPAPPFYNDGFFAYAVNNADEQGPGDGDSPFTGAAANPAQAAKIDVLWKYTLYLVWQYPSGIIYPIANILWQANFFADTNVQNLGVTNIVKPIGVTTGTYTPSNAVPGAMAEPLAISSLSWQ